MDNVASKDFDIDISMTSFWRASGQRIFEQRCLAGHFTPRAHRRFAETECAATSDLWLPVDVDQPYNSGQLDRAMEIRQSSIDI